MSAEERRPQATYTNILSQLEIDAAIGIHPEERAAPQRLTLDVSIDCAYETVPEDRLEAVLDYDFLRLSIHELVKSRHFELQETLCDQVAALALADPRVVRVRVRSMKLDIYPDARIGCEIERAR